MNRTQFIQDFDLMVTCYNDLKNIDKLYDMMVYIYENLDSMSNGRHSYIEDIINRSRDLDYTKIRAVHEKIKTYLNQFYPNENSLPTIKPGLSNILDGLCDCLHNILNCESYYDRYKKAFKDEWKEHIQELVATFAYTSGDYCHICNEIQNLIAIREFLLSK